MNISPKYILRASLTTLALVLLTSKTAAAQSCAVPPSCETLGYVRSISDCGAASSLKCPFDQSKVFCVTNLGGKACNIGDILFNDKTCGDPSNYDSTQTKLKPIGVVFDVGRRRALALNDVSDDKIQWFNDTSLDYEYWEYWKDIPSYATQEQALTDINGKEATWVIISKITQNEEFRNYYNRFPAFLAANDYKTDGTNVGDWYLPAVGELSIALNNKDILNATLLKIGGTSLARSLLWSSTQINKQQAYSISRTSRLYEKNKTELWKVRPAIAF